MALYFECRVGVLLVILYVWYILTKIIGIGKRIDSHAIRLIVTRVISGVTY